MSTPAITLYGIPNCDTVKKARAWLADQGVDYRFHDFKKQGVPADRLAGWVAAVGWERLVNRQGTTWRKLDAASQAAVQDAASASALMQANASVIKRPVVEWAGSADEQVSVGFDAPAWNERLAARSNG
ncbi:MAG: ArsC family reductase [Comamonadaceae bacterium]|nr:MAG: ArsC family reductase [Comamonadaceae bacterium]